MSIEQRRGKWYVIYPHSGILFSSKMNELEVHTSTLVMDPTNNRVPRVWCWWGTLEILL